MILELTKTYLFTNVTIKEYQDHKVLSFGKSATKECKPDTGEVTTIAESAAVTTTSHDRTLIGVISSVISTLNFQQCPFRNSKIEIEEDMFANVPNVML